MPVTVQKRDDEYCVVNADTGEMEGACFDTEDEAQAQANAMNASTQESVKVLSESPDEYRQRMESLPPDTLARDAQAMLRWLDRLAAVRSRRAVASIGAGWTGMALMETAELAQEAAKTPPGIVPTWHDGQLVFCEGREGLGDDLVRALFERSKTVTFTGPARESTGVGMVPAGVPLRDWWAKGRGSPKLRAFLAEYAAGEAVEEDTDAYDYAPFWADLDGLAVSIDSDDLEPMEDDSSYALVSVRDEPLTVLSRFETEERQTARDAAIAAVSEQHPDVALATLAGAATVEQIEGVPVYMGLTTYCLARESRAMQSLVDRVVESYDAPNCGRVLRVSEQDDAERAWEVVVIEAGLGFNDSIYFRDMLRDDLVSIMEGAPVEEIKFDPQTLDHLPDDVLRQFPDGVTGNVVGQLTDVRFEAEGGMGLQADVLNALSEKLNMGRSEIQEQAVGRIVATLQFDDSSRGMDAHAMVRAAHERGLLDKHPQLSVDFNEAPFQVIFHDGRELAIRNAVNDDKRVTISLVNRGAQGGRFLDRAA